MVRLFGVARLADLAPKESWSDTVPFRKMLVKVKNEIIRMNHPAIRPAAGRAGITRLRMDLGMTPISQLFDLTDERGVLRTSIAATSLIAVLGIGFGLYSGSFSIVFDGVYSLIDAGMSLLSKVMTASTYRI